MQIRDRLLAGCMVVAMIAGGILILWLAVIFAASLQGGLMNTNVVPAVIAIVLGILTVIGVAWLLRYFATWWRGR